MTDEEIREFHRKRLYEMSLKSANKPPILVEPTEEQKQFVKKIMKGWTCE